MFRFFFFFFESTSVQHQSTCCIYWGFPGFMPLWVDPSLHHHPSLLVGKRLVTVLFTDKLKTEIFLFLEHISALGVAETKDQG